MGTEEALVYSIIETAKKGTLSDDSKIDERLVRAFLRKYRAASIAKHSMSGHAISDECFQFVGLLRFDYVKHRTFQRELPKFIQLGNRYGMWFESVGENVPVVNSEEFSLALKSIINGKLPKAKFVGNKATIYAGENTTVNGKKKPVSNALIDDFENQIAINQNEFIEVEVYGVLDNPDDAESYDWTKDPYPCSSELIEEISTKILMKEYNLILNVRTDKVTDSNDEDSIRSTAKEQ